MEGNLKTLYFHRNRTGLFGSCDTNSLSYIKLACLRLANGGRLEAVPEVRCSFKPWLALW